MFLNDVWTLWSGNNDYLCSRTGYFSLWRTIVEEGEINRTWGSNAKKIKRSEQFIHHNIADFNGFSQCDKSAVNFAPQRVLKRWGWKESVVQHVSHRDASTNPTTPYKFSGYNFFLFLNILLKPKNLLWSLVFIHPEFCFVRSEKCTDPHARCWPATKSMGHF